MFQVREEGDVLNTIVLAMQAYRDNHGEWPGNGSAVFARGIDASNLSQLQPEHIVFAREDVMPPDAWRLKGPVAGEYMTFLNCDTMPCRAGIAGRYAVNEQEIEKIRAQLALNRHETIELQHDNQSVIFLLPSEE